MDRTVIAQRLRAIEEELARNQGQLDLLDSQAVSIRDRNAQLVGAWHECKFWLDQETGPSVPNPAPTIASPFGRDNGGSPIPPDPRILPSGELLGAAPPGIENEILPRPEKRPTAPVAIEDGEISRFELTRQAYEKLT